MRERRRGFTSLPEHTHLREGGASPLSPDHTHLRCILYFINIYWVNGGRLLDGGWETLSSCDAHRLHAEAHPEAPPTASTSHHHGNRTQAAADWTDPDELAADWTRTDAETNRKYSIKGIMYYDVKEGYREKQVTFSWKEATGCSVKTFKSPMFTPDLQI